MRCPACTEFVREHDNCCEECGCPLFWECRGVVGQLVHDLKQVRLQFCNICGSRKPGQDSSIPEKCANCQTECPFCGHCGTDRRQQPCQHCGVLCKPRARFCPSCTKPITFPLTELVQGPAVPPQAELQDQSNNAKNLIGVQAELEDVGGVSNEPVPVLAPKTAAKVHFPAQPF